MNKFIFDQSYLRHVTWIETSFSYMMKWSSNTKYFVHIENLHNIRYELCYKLAFTKIVEYFVVDVLRPAKSAVRNSHCHTTVPDM